VSGRPNSPAFAFCIYGRADRVFRTALTGRFIHITDFHPDPHYKAGATFESGCHRRDKKGHKGKGKEKATDLELDWEEEEDEDLGNDSVTKGKGESAGRWGSGVS
jgi:endopolyphosphatase